MNRGLKHIVFALSGTALMLFFSLRTTALLVDFLVNQDYIASVLCVEKDIPESTCNGMCHLKKTMEKEANSDHTDFLVEDIRITFFYESPQLESTTEFFHNSSTSDFRVDQGVMLGYPNGIFIPPNA